MKINAELTKFMGNIFGALCCYEGNETDINIQMFSYCENRKELWDYRTKFMRKFLRLDYDQMESFLDELDAILVPERDIFSRSNHKIDIYHRGVCMKLSGSVTIRVCENSEEIEVFDISASEFSLEESGTRNYDGERAYRGYTSTSTASMTSMCWRKPRK
jgi:hypothetical protein